VVNDEDVGLGDDVGGQGGEGDGEAKVAPLARPTGEGQGSERAGGGKVVGFVEDEQSAMRWTRSGAQAILDLRAVRINDDWDEYQQFHRCLNIRDSTISTPSPHLWPKCLPLAKEHRW